MDGEILKQAFFQIFRYLMLVFGSYLVERNIISRDFQDMTGEAVTAALFSAVVFIAPVVWGLANKRYFVLFAKTAKNTEPGAPMADVVKKVKRRHSFVAKI